MAKTTTILMMVLAISISIAVAGPTRPGREMPEPKRSEWIQQDARLRSLVSVEAKGRPVRAILAAVSKGTGVDVRASRELGECRVSLRTGRKTLGDFMGRLDDLFGHGVIPSKSTYWEKVWGEDKQIHYILKRSAYGRREQSERLNAPPKIAGQWLREMRRYGKLSPAKRDNFSGEWPVLQGYAAAGAALSDGAMGPVGEAVMALTDNQFATLLQQGEVELPQFHLSPAAIAQIGQVAHDQAPQGTQGANIEESPPTNAILRLMRDSQPEGNYGLTLSFRSGVPSYYPYGYDLDTLEMIPRQSDENALHDAESREQHSSVNLLEGEKFQPGQKPVMTLVVALDLLSRKADIHTYAETFLKKPQVLRFTQGKPEYLLSRLCRDYGCEWRKVGGDYVVWSKSWAQDREADVTQILIDQWSATRNKQGEFGLPTLLEMVKLTDTQITTLNCIFDLSRSLAPLNHDVLRLIASLPPQDRAAAYGVKGTILRTPSAYQMSMLRKIFGQSELDMPILLTIQEKESGAEIRISDQSGHRYSYHL